ncbi:MAG: DMT family transporter [Rhodocyclales bacterium]|nr:DMT family transporter [Rhodocyclales bacterium]
MSHRRAVILMIVVTLLWSMAGVVSRHLEGARSFEVTFWRSAFNALALAIALTVLRGPRLWSDLVRAPQPVWASGLCWAVMYTAFMVALTLTTVANVLVIMALGPLMTALLARLILAQRLPLRTWAAILLAGVGVVWMFARQLTEGVSLTGSVVALVVPLAASFNWTLLQAAGHRDMASTGEGAVAPDMLPAVLIGATLSAVATLPLAWPLQATSHDIGLLGFLGVFQLAVPCLLVVRLSRVLSGAEISLLGLLELVFGVALAWLGANEAPDRDTLVGGTLVVGALILNELLALPPRNQAAGRTSN